MGSWFSDVDAGTCPETRASSLSLSLSFFRFWSLSLDMARVQQILQLLLVVATLATVLASPMVKREAMSDGDGEAIFAFRGFYGSPVYRPYGFTSWGYGSPGFGTFPNYVASPNIYRGYNKY